jgi:hypothetical protein
MGRYSFDVTVLWGRGKEMVKQGNIPIEYFAAGDGLNLMSPRRSDRAAHLADLFVVEEAIDQQRRFSIVLSVVHAMKFVRPHWELLGIRLVSYEGQRQVHSVEATRPIGGFSGASKGLQRGTFSFSGQLVEVRS